MDLIYMNEIKEDLGVLQDYEMDLAFGADENNFECKIQSKAHCCDAGYYLYMEGTEYGGIIDSIQSDTENDEVTYSGRTWQGLLGSKIVLPLQNGENYSGSTGSTNTDGITQNGNQLVIAYGVTVTRVDNRLLIDSYEIGGDVNVETENTNGSLALKYLVISGDANACIQFIIDRVGLSDLFQAEEYVAGVAISQYQFHRYTDAYTGLVGMLKSAGLKLKTKFANGKVVLSAGSRYDYSKDEEFDSDAVEFKLKRNYKTVNHLICLGSGELENRLVVHLYADEEGNISREQTLFGMDEYSAVYDYSSVESEEELIASGKAELKKLWGQNELSISFDDDTDTYGVGDIVGAYDNVTKISVVATVMKKIVTIRNGQITISYEVGE